MKYSLSHTIIVCYEVFEHNNIIETRATYFFQKRQVVKLEIFFDNYTEHNMNLKLKET